MCSAVLANICSCMYVLWHTPLITFFSWCLKNIEFGSTCSASTAYKDQTGAIECKASKVLAFIACKEIGRVHGNCPDNRMMHPDTKVRSFFN